MLPWHIAHFAMWGRPDIVDDTLAYYHRILPAARTAAANQGCMGARWPKMADPSCCESPSDVGGFLVWQQPHPIYLAENGGLPHAVAAMVAGWDGTPNRPNPCFPDNHQRSIRSAGLAPVP